MKRVQRTRQQVAISGGHPTDPVASQSVSQEGRKERGRLTDVRLANDLMRISAQRLSLSVLPTLITRFMERRAARHILEVEASSPLPWRCVRSYTKYFYFIEMR